MSRTHKESKPPGYEYWSSRYPKHFSEWYPGPRTKKLTHKFERQQSKRIARNSEDTLGFEEDTMSWTYGNYGKDY